jgi:Fur family ferric uptake transcriptional regulator
VRAELATAADFRSAQDIHAQMRLRGTPVGLATVYRALQSLVETGQADLLRIDSGESMYRACETDTHHHHLVCRSCNRTVEVQGPAVERWASRIADEHGFGDVSHTVELFGVCPTCQTGASRA